ncbi:MAG: arsenate reductase ArsC [Marinobacter sp.]|nr:arsenate reductase ArsC [Marinobacter sp.]
MADTKQSRQRVLFLCTGNSCRSQMAEGLLRAHHGDRYEVVSAGTHPVAVNPWAIKVMADGGYDISGQRSQSLDEFQGEPVDVVVSVCDAACDICPDFPGSSRIHWSVPDPAGAEGSEDDILEQFRSVRDELRDRIDRAFGPTV